MVDLAAPLLALGFIVWREYHWQRREQEWVEERQRLVERAAGVRLEKPEPNAFPRGYRSPAELARIERERAQQR